MLIDNLACQPQVERQLFSTLFIILLLNFSHVCDEWPPDGCIDERTVDDEKDDFPHDVVNLFDDEGRR